MTPINGMGTELKTVLNAFRGRCIGRGKQSNQYVTYRRPSIYSPFRTSFYLSGKEELKRQHEFGETFDYCRFLQFFTGQRKSLFYPNSCPLFSGRPHVDKDLLGFCSKERYWSHSRGMALHRERHRIMKSANGYIRGIHARFTSVRAFHSFAVLQSFVRCVLGRPQWCHKRKNPSFLNLKVYLSSALIALLFTLFHCGPVWG